MGSSTTVAGAYLGLLGSRGVRALYLNAGTDFAPLVEAYAREGGDDAYPEPVVGGHENLVAGMAHGAFLVTGEPQVVMFHVSVGTANAVCAVMNAARERVPMIVTAGRTPILEHGALGARDTTIHWAQELFDQAGVLRELVKWDYELRDPRQLAGVVERAFAVATTHPQGPVYLTLPREVLAEAHDHDEHPASFAVPAPPSPDPAAVAELADRLASARLPVVVPTASGADPRSVALLAELCERFAVGVAESMPRHLNLPADHPLHLGAQREVQGEADVLVFLEAEVPWMPAHGAPRDDAFVVQAGVDPLYGGYPVRGHRSDLTIAASATNLLTALLEALAARAQAIDPARGEVLRARATQARERREAAAARERDRTGPITKALLSQTLGAVLDPDAVVFNEYWGQPALLGRRVPGTYHYLPASGGLGWALPAALGARHAAPERTVVALVGDGAYLFANPAACHHAAQKHGLPVLTVIADNARWGAVDGATRAVYPDGVAVGAGESRLSDLAPSPAFEAYARASGGLGLRVTERAELRAALEQALHAVTVEGRQAVVSVGCA